MNRLAILAAVALGLGACQTMPPEVPVAERGPHYERNRKIMAQCPGFRDAPWDYVIEGDSCFLKAPQYRRTIEPRLSCIHVSGSGVPGRGGVPGFSSCRWQ